MDGVEYALSVDDQAAADLAYITVNVTVVVAADLDIPPTESSELYRLLGRSGRLGLSRP